MVFVPDSLPGEISRVRIDKIKKRSFALGTKLETLRHHEGAVDAACPHFGSCGGCSLQTLAYVNQLMLKEKIVVNTFKRIGSMQNVENGLFKGIQGCDHVYQYRNKVEFSVGQGVIGKHLRGSSEIIVPIKECKLQSDASERLYQGIQWYLQEAEDDLLSEIQHIVIRWSDAYENALVNIVTQNPSTKRLAKFGDYLGSKYGQVLRGIVNTSVSNDSRCTANVYTVWGQGDLLERLGPYTFRISPNSFFQVNTAQTKRLYEYVVEAAGINTTHVVFDLYCGTGTISLFLAKYAKKVYGIEVVESSIKDAKYNARLNGIENVEFVQGDVGMVVSKVLGDNNTADIVVVDPARAGLSKRAIQGLLNLKPRKIVYVSCNVATQGRDIKDLLQSGMYRVDSIKAFDLFPQTTHVESVVVCSKV